MVGGMASPMAEAAGFEPTIRESKSRVIPFNDVSIWNSQRESNPHLHLERVATYSG